MPPDPLEPAHARAVLVMGVTATGKSTVGKALALQLGAAFIEGDDCHSAQNLLKMRSRIPLEDDDRWPWLTEIVQRVKREVAARGQAVASCSALKRSYRDFLRAHLSMPIYFLCLEAERDVLESRLAARTEHFMPATLLASQLHDYERPAANENALIVRADLPRDRIVAEAASWLRDTRIS